MSYIRLSSRLTLAYKLLLPLGGLIAWMSYTWLMLSQHWLLELHAVLASYCAVMLVVFTLLISLRIRHVAYNEHFIQIRNYGKPVLLPVEEFVLLEPTFPFGILCRLRTSTRSVLFLSSYGGLIGNVLQLDLLLSGRFEPENVTIARKTLTRSKASFAQ